MRFKSTVAAGLLAFCSAGAASAQTPLSGDDLREFVVGNNLEARVMGMKATMSIRRDGTTEMASSMRNDVGTWRISGNQMCMRWKKRNNGAERCVIFERLDDGRFSFPGGPKMHVVGPAS